MGENESAGGLPRASREVVIKQPQGLHARPAAMFVERANTFDAEIRVGKGGEEVDGKSIMGIMMLAAGVGDRVTIEAFGPEAEEAVEVLADLVAADE